MKRYKFHNFVKKFQKRDLYNFNLYRKYNHLKFQILLIICDDSLDNSFVKILIRLSSNCNEFQITNVIWPFCSSYCLLILSLIKMKRKLMLNLPYFRVFKFNTHHFDFFYFKKFLFMQKQSSGGVLRKRCS